MKIDLHSHTYYSHCGRDEPEKLILKMIEKGVEIFGICDHNYGIGDREEKYLKEIRHLQKKYAYKIKIFCGIEICTRPGLEPLEGKTFSEYDYCLIEDLDNPSSVMKGDIINYTKNFECPVGIAHTDLFKFIADNKLDCKKYLKELAEANIFWELNVNYDSIHKYREHEYLQKFFKSEFQQNMVKETGLCVSIGFDGHRLEEYNIDRVEMANRAVCLANIKNAVKLLV